MVYNIILAATLIVAFFMCVAAFVVGVKVGKSLSEGKVPQVNINPLKPIIKAVEKHKEEKAIKQLSDELEEVMTYSADKALKAIKDGEVT